MTQYAVEGVAKENKKLRKKLAKQQEEFNNYREELANQVGEELAKQREELANQREEIDELRQRLEQVKEESLGCGPPIGDLSIGDLSIGYLSIGVSKQSTGGGVKTEASFLNGHDYTYIGSAYGEIVNAVIKTGCCAEVGDGSEEDKKKQKQRERVQKTRVDCKVCGGVSSTDKHRKLSHENSSVHQKALGGGN